MITHYLKSVDEAALYEALEAAGIVVKSYDSQDPANQQPEDAPESWEPSGTYTYGTQSGYDLDVIGLIYQPQEDPEAEPVPEDGYFANVRSWTGDLTPEQLEVLPTISNPNHPVRIWAGD